MSFLPIETGFEALDWGNLLMLLLAFGFLYLSIAKNLEPYVLLPISIGIILANLPLTGMLAKGEGLLWILEHYGIGAEGGWSIIPPMIFIGLGAMTDFSPILANPKTLLLGFSAQLGIFIAFIGALLLGFGTDASAAIAIIGGADGPTTIYATSKLAADLLPATTVAAYAYMALVPIFQPPVARLLTTQKERKIRMKQLRPVSRTERLLFPLMGLMIVVLLIPESATLIGMLFFGNILRESGVVPRLSETAQRELTNLVTIFLGLVVGSLLSAEAFLKVETLKVFGLGLLAIIACTAAGILLAKLMNLFVKEKVNPLIGAAGVSAVPMAARVAQMIAHQEDPHNYILMHAMGPNIAGVIGSAAVAGVFLGLLG